VNAITLYRCSKCRAEHWSKETAENCCGPLLCECGSKCAPYRTACNSCLAAKELERESALFEKAKKVPYGEYGGPIYTNESYWDNVDEYASDTLSDGMDLPKYAWATNPVPFYIDATDIVEAALDGHHEDAWSQVGDLGELQGMLDKWCSEQAVRSFEPDYETAIILEGYPVGDE
jgi:hypothetical protein